MLLNFRLLAPLLKISLYEMTYYNYLFNALVSKLYPKIKLPEKFKLPK